MLIALASPGAASTLDEGLDKIQRLLGEASARGAAIVCFPEAYLPGLRGQDVDVAAGEQAGRAVAGWRQNPLLQLGWVYAG